MRGIISIVIFFGLVVTPVAASLLPNIPNDTLQIAKEAELKTALENPKSELIRVGIGDNTFRNYDYASIDIFGNSNVEIYDNDKEILNVPANETVNIKIMSGMFVISINNQIADQVNGPLQIVCKNGYLGIKGLRRAGKQALYRGDFKLVKSKYGKFYIVNVIEVEDYLKGVVPNEMPVTFGLEALKAQSVAARNYVLSPRIKANPEFDVVDSVASQVYFGANTERELSTQAVEETEGVVALYNWDLILAQYSSTAGGYTESFANVFSDPVTKAFPSVKKPYLIAKPDILSQTPLNTEADALRYYKSKPDSYDIKSPYFRWERYWTQNELQQNLQQNLAAQSATGFVEPRFNVGEKLDEVTALEVVSRGESGKIIELDIVTKTKRYKVFKELVVRRLLTCQGKALPSANVAFEQEFDDDGNLLNITAYGGGFGHGVGLSQYGAGFMATELNMSFDKILKHYYTDITLATKPIILSTSNNAVVQNFYTKHRHAKLIVDNKYKLPHFLVNINGKEYKIDLYKNLFSRVETVDISKYINLGKNTITFYYPQNTDKNKELRLYIELVEKNE